MIFMNRVWLQGRVATAPVLKDLTSTTKLTSFTLALIESWKNGDGKDRDRINSPLVEVVGRDAVRIAHEARIGAWITLEGYIRTEEVKGQHVTKVRTLTITVWPEAPPWTNTTSSQKLPPA